MKLTVQAINRFLFGAITAAATATVGASDNDNNHLRRTAHAVSTSTSDHDRRRLADRVTNDDDNNNNNNNSSTGNVNIDNTITRRFQHHANYEDAGATVQLLSNTAADSANGNTPLKKKKKKCHLTDLGSLVSCPKKGESCRPLLVMHDEQQKDGGYGDDENTNTNTNTSWYCMSDDESTIGITTMMMATTMEDEEEKIMMDEMKVCDVLILYQRERAEFEFAFRVRNIFDLL